MRRIGIALVAVALALTACSGDDETATTTTVASATTTTTVATTTTATTTTQSLAEPNSNLAEGEATTTTTTEAPPPPAGSMLITNEDGVFVATLGGVVAQILAADSGAVGGIVDFAMDDTRGGIVVHPNHNPWFSTGSDSIVYWAPEGSGALQQLLVPAADQGLRLEDVQPQGDTVMVYYTRRFGDTPDTAEQTLRSFDLDTKTVTEVALVGGWESGTSPISVGGNTIVRNGSGEAFFWIYFSDLADNLFDSPANPMPDGEVDCLPECFYYADLSADGSQVALGRLAPNSSGFYTIPEIELRDVASGAVLLSVALPERPGAGFIDSLDVSDTHVLINIVEEGSVFPVATVVEIASGGLVVANAPIGGVARFLRTAPDLDGVITWP